MDSIKNASRSLSQNNRGRKKHSVLLKFCIGMKKRQSRGASEDGEMFFIAIMHTPETTNTHLLSVNWCSSWWGNRLILWAKLALTNDRLISIAGLCAFCTENVHLHAIMLTFANINIYHYAAPRSDNVHTTVR